MALDQGKPRADVLLGRLLDEEAPLRVPAAAWVEFLSGVNEAHRTASEAVLQAATLFHPFGVVEARAAVSIQSALRVAGRPLAWSDLQIAATAITLGEPLVSNDQAFRRVPGLDVVGF